MEDLLKRLPGIEVDIEGKITTATEKTIRRVFVDGKEFFGNDPKMATQNLNADMVEQSSGYRKTVGLGYPDRCGRRRSRNHYQHYH